MGLLTAGSLLHAAVVAAVVAVAVAVAACKGGSAGGARDAGPAPGAAAGSATPAAPGDVLARVGDRVITVAEFVAALEHMDQFDRMRYQAPERREELLGEMIDVMLLADEARAKGYDKEPVTQQEIREVLRDAMLRRAHDGAPPPSAIPDDEARAYFEQHRADFRDPERRRLSAIVVGSGSAAGALVDAAARASATQWGDLVRTKSLDPRARSGAPADLAGDLGFVSPPGDSRGANPDVPEAVRAALFAIAKVGEVYPHPVKAGAGFYVVKWTARTEPHDRTFDDVKRAIQVKLSQEKMRAREDTLVGELRKQYPVEVDESALGEVRVDLPGVDGGP